MPTSLVKSKIHDNAQYAIQQKLNGCALKKWCKNQLVLVFFHRNAVFFLSLTLSGA
jgi:hypothetical protein